jgi:hypothetical protein
MSQSQSLAGSMLCGQQRQLQYGAAAAAAASLCLQSIGQDRHKIVVSADGMLPARSASYAADEEDHKYARRAHPLKRTLQRLFPGMFAPGLPVTARCGSGARLTGSSNGLLP